MNNETITVPFHWYRMLVSMAVVMADMPAFKGPDGNIYKITSELKAEIMKALDDVEKVICERERERLSN